MSKVFEKWKFLSLFFVLFMVLGVVSYGKADVTSGATDFVVYLDKTSTTLGGDPINIAINVLNASGAVNTASNGQVGDVLFEVTSQLGVTSWRDITGNGLINAGDNLCNNGGDDDGDGFVDEPDECGHPLNGFAADVDQYLQPINGRAAANITYGTVSGTDTIVVRMYESVMAGGAVNPSQVVPGQLLAEETISVTVASGAPTVRDVAVVIGNDANNNMAPDNVIDDPGNNFGNGANEFVRGERLNTGLGINGNRADMTQSMAGMQFALHVYARSANAIDQTVSGAIVKVAFIKVADITFTDGNADPELAAGSPFTDPTQKALIYTTDHPEGVEEIEVTLNDGRWDGTVELKEAGYFLPVVYQTHDDGTEAINVQRANANAINNIILHYVAPNTNVPPSSIVLSSATNTIQDDPDDDALNDDNVGSLTVKILDEFGNEYPASTNYTVSFSLNPDGSIANQAINTNNSVTTPSFSIADLPDNIGSVTIKASIAALGLDSNTLSLTVVDNALANQVDIIAGTLGGDDVFANARVVAINDNNEITVPMVIALPALGAPGAGWTAGVTTNVGFTGQFRVLAGPPWNIEVDLNTGAGLDGAADVTITINDGGDAAWGSAGTNDLTIAIGGMALVDDDGTLDGARTITAGTPLRVWLSKAMVENSGLVGATAYIRYKATSGSTETATAIITQTEQGVFGQDVDGNGTNTDYIVTFTPTKAVADATVIFGIQGDPIAPIRLANNAAQVVVGIVAGVGGMANAGNPNYTVQAASATQVQYVDFLGNELTTFDLNYGRNFTLLGQRFKLNDGYGNLVAPANNLNFISGIASVDNPAGLTALANNVNDWNPGWTSLTNAGLNMGLTRDETVGDLDNSLETLTVQYLATVADTQDTLRLTLSSTAASSYDLTLLNIGNPYTQIVVSSIGGETETVKMPQNGVIPLVVETLDSDGNRIPSDNNELILHVGSALINVTDAANIGVIRTTGYTFDTIAGDDAIGGEGIDGRQVFMVSAGASTGEVEVWVITTDGTKESNHLTIDVTSIVPLSVTPPSVEVATGAIAEVSIVGGTAPYTVTSSDETIATASVSDDTVTITGVAEGNCTITVTDSSSPAQTADISVTVTSVPAACPIINAMTLDMGSILSGGTGIVDHYDFGDFGTPGTMPYIYVQTATASDSAVDVYVKVTYPDARSAWLYEEAGAMIYHDPTVTPNPEYSGQVFSEGTVLPILTWWFNPAYKYLTNAETGGYELPDGVYTWDIYLLPAGTSISNPDDVAANACASATASVTLTTDRP